MKSILPILVATALQAPAAASAEPVAPDPDARQLTALGGTIVWTSGRQPTKLMLRAPDGTVGQVAEAAVIRNPDLGRDAKNRLVLTYARCASFTDCVYVREDFERGRTKLRLAPKHCAVSSTPAVWGSAVAYGLSCFKMKDGRRASDDARSGLYLRKGAKKAIRFTPPRDARRSGSLEIRDVDLRGSQVAAVYADISEYAIVQSTTGSLRYSERVASTEGDGEQTAAGVTIGTGDARLWVLTRSSYAGDPARSIIQRFGHASCSDYQTIKAADGSGDWDYPYLDLAADNGTLYAVDAGVGIVTHAYQPMGACS